MLSKNHTAGPKAEVHIIFKLAADLKRFVNHPQTIHDVLKI